MKKLHFPETFKHEHHIEDVNELFDERISTGQRATDWLEKALGSWRFISTQSIL